MNKTYDVVVLGLGGMGSAAAYHAARRGQRVLGLDAYPRGHTRGSSHGRSRIIREAYYEAPEYVPLVQRAYALWRELEAESGRKLLWITGGLAIGRPDSRPVRGNIASARAHDLPYEYLAPADVMARFPGLRLSDDLVAVYQPNAGILDPEACVEAHLDLAAGHGAELRHEQPIRHWAADGDGVRVETPAGAFDAGRLVVTAGPWAGGWLADLGLPLRVVRVVNVHFEPTRPELFTPDRCPVSGWVVPEGHYYGVPGLADHGFKLGRHDVDEACTPDTIRREVDESEIEMHRAMLERYMPGAAGAVKWSFTCMYTMTPDGNFVIDRHRRHPQVAYGCGFSGHGFKFASVVGEVLADLALDGRTRHPIGFLASDRFAPAPTS